MLRARIKTRKVREQVLAFSLSMTVESSAGLDHPEHAKLKAVRPSNQVRHWLK